MTAGVGFTFNVNRSGVDALLHDPSGVYGRRLLALTNRVANYAKEGANVDTGNMRSRVEPSLIVEGQELTGIVAVRVAYALFVLRGTQFYAGNNFLLAALQRGLSEGL